MHLFPLTACTLCRRGLFVLLKAVPGGLCALPKFVCLPSVGTSVLRFARVVFASSVLQGLCALAVFVCCTTLGSPERARLFGVTVHGLLMD